MSTIRHKGRVINADLLPLFAWATERDKRTRLTYPARWIMRHGPLSATRALLIADLAGLRSDAR
jgi:hypothetical protein